VLQVGTTVYNMVAQKSMEYVALVNDNVQIKYVVK